MCPKYANHSRLNSQHDWEDLINRFMIARKNLRFDNELDYHMNPENYEANGYEHDLDLLIT